MSDNSFWHIPIEFGLATIALVISTAVGVEYSLPFGLILYFLFSIAEFAFTRPKETDES